MPGPSEWTAPLVLAGLRKAFAAEPRLGELPTSFSFIVERAREVLRRDSPEYTALILRVSAPIGLSIREMCRQGYGWRRSRSELYRRSHNGAVRVAAALAADRVAMPAELLPAGTCQ
jgi:hypothetical protein